MMVRKSERTPQAKTRSYSPTFQPTFKRKKNKTAKSRSSQTKNAVVRPYDKLANGEPFSCSLCKSRYVCNPRKRKNPGKQSNHQPTPVERVDKTTGELLLLCNRCGHALMEPPRKVKKTYPLVESKEKYLDEARTFASSLAEGLDDPDAERLSCPNFHVQGCGCLQRYIIGDGELEESKTRASQLLSLLKHAKTLSAKKFYPVPEVPDLKKKARLVIGYGNGHRKSKEFEEFVIEKRKYLRDELKLCERAAQRVLVYSNNFLHKKMKTNKERPYRGSRVKGKAALGQLKPIEDLIKQKCCVDNCVMMTLTHSSLLEDWRQRAQQGQYEMKKVLAEMLTPSGGVRVNCYQFISSVVGCSNTTITKVANHVRLTRGRREPPQHGLRKYWEAKKKATSGKGTKPTGSTATKPSNKPDTVTTLTKASKNKKNLVSQNNVLNQKTTADTGASATFTALPGPVTWDTLRNQQLLLQLQKQLSNQQQQIKSQLQLIDQQLIGQQLQALQQGGQMLNATGVVASTSGKKSRGTTKAPCTMTTMQSNTSLLEVQPAPSPFQPQAQYVPVVQKPASHLQKQYPTLSNSIFNSTQPPTHMGNLSIDNTPGQGSITLVEDGESGGTIENMSINVHVEDTADLASPIHEGSILPTNRERKTHDQQTNDQQISVEPVLVMGESTCEMSQIMAQLNDSSGPPPNVNIAVVEADENEVISDPQGLETILRSQNIAPGTYTLYIQPPADGDIDQNLGREVEFAGEETLVVAERNSSNEEEVLEIARDSPDATGFSQEFLQQILLTQNENEAVQTLNDNPVKQGN
ncbi:unnamed protein product [Owenia fusiformis]|uniref:Uncharacterized protein n=1 Tax=Owenia fusiformis TaxID=6347 RepID=A0A8J1YD84_OWEFU|nr:unnamed protein product [Owenia fusiformis]